MRKEISQTKLIATNNKNKTYELSHTLRVLDFSKSGTYVRATASDRELPNMHMAIRNLVPLTDKFWNL